MPSIIRTQRKYLEFRRRPIPTQGNGYQMNMFNIHIDNQQLDIEASRYAFIRFKRVNK